MSVSPTLTPLPHVCIPAVGHVLPASLEFSPVTGSWLRLANSGSLELNLCAFPSWWTVGAGSSVLRVLGLHTAPIMSGTK